jgi:mannosyltransferase
MNTNATIRTGKDLAALQNLNDENSRAQRTKISSGAATSIILVLAILFAVSVSIFALSKQSLRLDEAQSLWQSSRSPKGIFYVIAQDVHVPLYPLMLHYWESFFGDGVAQARVLSLIFFLASIPATFMLGRLAYNRTIGLFAALLVAASPFLNWYGNEIRMYSLLMFVAIINQYFFIKLFKNQTGPRPDQTGAWWGYGLSALVGIYTHYFFWFILGTQGLFYLFNRDKFSPRALKNFILIVVMLLAAIAPWLYYVAKVGQIGHATPILFKPNSINFFNTFSQFIFGFQNDHLNTIIVALWPLSVLFLFLSLRKHQKISPETVYFFLSSLMPIILAFIVSITLIPLFLTRYMIFTVPSLFIFVSWFLATYPKKLSISFKTALVLLMLLTLANQAQSAYTPVKEDYKEVSGFLDQKATAQDVIIISAPFTVYPIEYYYKGPASLNTLPIWDRFTSGAIPAFNQQLLPAQVDQLKGSHERAFLVLSYDQGYENNLKTYFDTHFERLDQKNFSTDLHIYVYKLRYDNTGFDSIIKATEKSGSTGP